MEQYDHSLPFRIRLRDALPVLFGTDPVQVIVFSFLQSL